MISRALARDIADFTNLVESHLARMIEVIHRKMRRLGKDERDALVRDSLVLAFRDRNNFDPQLESVMLWFARSVEESMFGDVIPDADEVAMLATFDKTPYGGVQADLYWIDEAAALSVATATSESAPRTKVDPILKAGKDCPPCWRCRFYDGWLPRGEVTTPFCADPGVYEAIKNLDRRKIEIAHYVRGEYPAELLED